MNLPPKLSSLTRPLVFYVTDRKSLSTDANKAALIENIRNAIAAGCDFVQIREKDLSARELVQLVRETVSVASASHAAKVIVNDRLDAAIAANAGGVHLGGSSLPTRDVMRWRTLGHAPAESLVGVSCHSVEEIRAAERDGADYVFFGPVFDTPSKRSFGSPQGVDRLREACGAVKIPVIAIGGVDEGNSAECIRAGAAGIAAIRMFQEAVSVESLRAAIARIHAIDMTKV